ncbi:MAG: DUF58 domain-containing protein [Ruminiclostridium sp.]|nr:DUF58 domain-containing protein [Ruminiclostridium sp.]
MELIAILIIVGAVVFGEQLLYRKLVLKNVEYRVDFNVTEAFEGDTIEIVEEITNNKWLPVPWLKTELSTSRWLEFTGSAAARGSDARFVPSVFALKPYQKCTRTRKAVALKRGVFTLESTSLIGSDLLGLASVSRSVRTGKTIRILPSPYEVGEGELSHEELYGEIMTRRFICEDPFLTSGSREYTGREPMNRIHWSSTARQGKLMVFNNEFTTTNRVLILLNLQKSAEGDPRPPITADTETMIKAAAFLLNMYSERGISVSFGTNGSGKILLEGGSAEEDYLKILRCMAELENTCDMDFGEFMGRIDFEEITDIVIITPYIDERIIAHADMQKRMGRGVLFYCNDEESCDYQLIKVGRIHKYLFLKD